MCANFHIRSRNRKMPSVINILSAYYLYIFKCAIHTLPIIIFLCSIPLEMRNTNHCKYVT